MSRHLERGELLADTGRHRQAIDEFVQASLETGGDPEALALAAFSAIQVDDRDLADDFLAQARAVDADNLLVLSYGAIIAAERGRHDEAMRLMDRVLAIVPANPDMLGSAALVAIMGSRWKAALQHAEHGLRLDPTHEGCLNAARQAQNHDAPQRFDYGSRLLRSNPQNADAHIALADLAGQEDRDDDEHRHLLEALRLDPDSSEALIRLTASQAQRTTLMRFLSGGKLGRFTIPFFVRFIGLFFPLLLMLGLTVVMIAIHDIKGLEPPTGDNPWLKLGFRLASPLWLGCLWLHVVTGFIPMAIFWHVVRNRRLCRLMLKQDRTVFVRAALAGAGFVVLACAPFSDRLAIVGLAWVITSTLVSYCVCLSQKTSINISLATTLAFACVLGGGLAIALDSLGIQPAGPILWSLLGLNLIFWVVFGAIKAQAATPPPLPSR